MNRIVYAGLAAAALATGSFVALGRAEQGNGACMSACARAVAEHRQMCSRENQAGSESFHACMAAAQEHWEMCKAGCQGGM
jgi:hypothetical protein